MTKEQQHIEKIRAGKNGEPDLLADTYNALHIISDKLYSKPTHFILELIQNAEDNKYQNADPSLRFYLCKEDPTNTPNSSGSLIIYNNETGFTAENVSAICSIGKTTKKKAQEYIGEKGIGFKSVFRISSSPHILSNNYCFFLPEKDKETGLGFIVPVWWDNPPENLMKEGGTTIILPLDKQEFNYQNIRKKLLEIEPVTILFLEKITEIIIKTDSGDNFSIIKDNSRFPTVEMIADGIRDSKKISLADEFIIAKKNFNRPENIIQEQREDIKNRDVFIVYPKKINNSSNGKIFAYLPIDSVDSRFPFIINADFILDPARGNFDECNWNKWLFDCVAELVSESFSLLKDNGLLTISFLEILSIRLNELKSKTDDCLFPVLGRVRNALLENEYLPSANDGEYITGKNAKLSRTGDLLKIVNSDDLTSLYERKSFWLSTNITSDKTHALRSYITGDLGIKEITPEELCRKITNDKEFLKNKSQIVKWFRDFYIFLRDQPSFYRAYDGFLRSRDFVLLEDSRIVAPFSEDGKRRNVFMPSEITENNVVKHELLEDSEVKEFFVNNLGIKKPNLEDEIYNRILPLYDNEKYNDTGQYFPKLFIFYKDCPPSQVGSYVDLLKSKKTILFNKNKKSFRFRGYPTEVYFPTDELRHYFEIKPDVKFLDIDFYYSLIDGSDHARLKGFFSNLGVKELPRIIENEVDAYAVGFKYNARNLIDKTIDGSDDILMNLTKDNAIILWNMLLLIIKENNHVKFLYGEHRAGSWETFESSLLRKLRSKQWLITKDNKFVIPKNIYTEDLSDEYDTTSNEAILLIRCLGIRDNSEKQKAADILGLDLTMIELIKSNPESFRKWMENIKVPTNDIPRFPQKKVINTEQRSDFTAETHDASEKKRYEKVEQIVRVSSPPEGEKKQYYKELYTNDENIMVCQICRKEMPFKKPNKEYYFVTCEITINTKKEPSEVKKEAVQSYLALCPTCAAKYNVFVHTKPEEMSKICTQIKNTPPTESESTEIPVSLDKEQTITFVAPHLLEFKIILEKESQ